MLSETETVRARDGEKISPWINKHMHLVESQPTGKKGKHYFYRSHGRMYASRRALHMWGLHKLVNTLLFPSRAIRSVPLKATGWMRAKRQIAQLIAAFQHSIWPWSDYSENKNLDIKIWFPRQGRETCATELKLPFNIVHFCQYNERSRPLFGG